MTPSLLGGLGPSVLQDQVLSRRSRVRVLVLGGEAFPSLSLLRSWRQNGNRTQIYNIYGITEVSCWACCHRVPQHLLLADQVDSLVPLGDALMGTSVEVRDEKNEVVTEGEGQVFLGGEHRVCLIDGERTLISGTMRPTGDWVRVRDRQIHFLGRRDRLIKRLGQRVNLDTVQQMAITLPQVASCAVGLYKGFRLVAFAVVSPPADRRPENLLSVQQHVEPGLPTSISPQGDFTSSRVPQGDGGLRGELQGDGDLQEDLQGDAGLQRAILQQFRLLLPSSSVPDSLLILPALPLTPHGKVDMAALMNIYQKQRERSETRSSLQNLTQLKQRLTALWQDVLGLPEDATVADGSSFLFSGGDSLKALRLCDDLTTVVGLSSPGLLGVLLDGSFSDVLRHVATVTGMILPLEDGRQAKKRPAEPPVDVPNKREHREPGGAGGPTSGEGRVKVIRRAGQVIVMNIRNSKQDTVEQHRTPESTKTTNNSVTAGTSMEGVGDVAPPTGHTGDMELSLLWSSDTGRCVDASPVLLVRGGGVDQNSQGGALATVFIGSHSHRLQALDLATGAVQWERVLGDRIESSAAVTRCGGLVVVGCYDGGVYFLCVASGETRWLFETGDAVKSSPTVDPATGMVLVGSHDGHLYALNPQLHVCVWRRHCGGAVFSSPFLEQNQRRLYVASLSGTLLCLDPDDGAVLWTYDRETPFFSSPIGSSGRVVIGSVDGNICAFSDMGKLLWQFGTGGPVFSSPCVMPDQQRVLCGSHDGHLYCLELANGSVVWRFQTPGRVYASPCLLEGSAAGRRGVLVGLASTDGTVWILDVRDGKQLASITLPGEVFSSPVAWEHSLVVGCRNDMVYCMQLAARRDAEER